MYPLEKTETNTLNKPHHLKSKIQGGTGYPLVLPAKETNHPRTAAQGGRVGSGKRMALHGLVRQDALYCKPSLWKATRLRDSCGSNQPEATPQTLKFGS